MCAESDVERLYEADDIGIEALLICLEREPGTCSFALVCGGVFCRCPLYVHLATRGGC